MQHQEGLFTYGFIDQMSAHLAVQELRVLRLVNRRVKAIADRRIFHWSFTDAEGLPADATVQRGIVREFMRQISPQDIAGVVGQLACIQGSVRLFEELNNTRTVLSTGVQSLFFLQARYPQYEGVLSECMRRFRVLVDKSQYLMAVYEPVDLSSVRHVKGLAQLAVADAFFKRLNDLHYAHATTYGHFQLVDGVKATLRIWDAVAALDAFYTDSDDTTITAETWEPMLHNILTWWREVAKYREYYGRLAWITTPAMRSFLDRVVRVSSSIDFFQQRFARLNLSPGELEFLYLNVFGRGQQIALALCRNLFPREQQQQHKKRQKTAAE